MSVCVYIYIYIYIYIYSNSVGCHYFTSWVCAKPNRYNLKSAQYVIELFYNNNNK